jgi:hypothetical protein
MDNRTNNSVESKYNFFVLNFKGIYFNLKEPRIYEKIFILNFSSEHPYDNLFTIKANTEVILTLNTVIGPVTNLWQLDTCHWPWFVRICSY